MPSTLSAAGDLVIVEPPATARTTQCDPGRASEAAAGPLVDLQSTGR